MASGWLGRVTSPTTKSYGWQDTTHSPSIGYQLGDQYGRHNQGATYAFMDGHTKWLTPNLVSPGASAVNPTDAAQTGAGTAAGTADAIDNPRYIATFSAM
jgi:prepilin-type processing-associated H-X9-DG protein